MQIKIKEHALSLVSENYYCVLFLLGLLNKEGVVSHYGFESSASRFSFYFPGLDFQVVNPSFWTQATLACTGLKSYEQVKTANALV